jgi:hypothetical protein
VVIVVGILKTVAASPVFISKLPHLNLLFEFADMLVKPIVIFTHHATASPAPRCKSARLGFFSPSLAQAQTGAPTIFANELDAGSFKCPSNDL